MTYYFRVRETTQTRKLQATVFLSISRQISSSLSYITCLSFSSHLPEKRRKKVPTKIGNLKTYVCFATRMYRMFRPIQRGLSAIDQLFGNSFPNSPF